MTKKDCHKRMMMAIQSAPAPGAEQPATVVIKGFV